MGMDREDLIEAARALVPALRERAEDTEAARRIPDATHAAFVDAGLYRMFQPERFGGGEMDLALMVDVAMEIGRGCGSSAWNLTNIAVQGWIGGMHYPETQEELWADNPAALIARRLASRLEIRCRLRSWSIRNHFVVTTVHDVNWHGAEAVQ